MKKQFISYIGTNFETNYSGIDNTHLELPNNQYDNTFGNERIVYDKSNSNGVNMYDNSSSDNVEQNGMYYIANYKDLGNVE